MNEYLLDQNFNKIQWSICDVVKKTFTQSQLNILSGGLIECLDEPRHAGVGYSTETHHTAARPREGHSNG